MTKTFLTSSKSVQNSSIESSGGAKFIDNRWKSSPGNSTGASQLKPQEDDILQGKSDVNQRAAEEEDSIQAKFVAVQKMSEDEDWVSQGKFKAEQSAVAQKKNSTGMPDNLKAGLESLSGMNMDHVRVHQNSSKPASVQAHAYTQGSDIHVAPGQMQHLPHEAWHVVQQAQGRVQPTTTVNGMPVNDNPTLETEADVMGDKASKL